MPDTPLLDPNEFQKRLEAATRPYHEGYYAMYSSVVGGIVTHPGLMVVPVDDHMVHRGDAVFETAKYVDRGIYNLEAHIDRLFDSARQLEIHSRFNRDEICCLVVDTCRAADHRDGVIRILLSRGPGSMGVNPYDCPQAQLYIVVYQLPDSFMDRHPGGAAAKKSVFTVKMDFLARVKSCNYLLNALMRKEAADSEVDFVFAYDDEGFLAEGPTETVGIVTNDGELQVPLPERILPGTTMERIWQMAGEIVQEGLLAGVRRCHLTPDAVAAAREVLMFGTTTDVTAVTNYDDQAVGGGKAGPVYHALRERLLADIRTNTEVRTMF